MKNNLLPKSSHLFQEIYVPLNPVIQRNRQGKSCVIKRKKANEIKENIL